MYKKDHPDWWMAKSVITGCVGWVPRNAIALERKNAPPVAGSSGGTAATIPEAGSVCIARHDFTANAENQVGEG